MYWWWASLLVWVPCASYSLWLDDHIVNVQFSLKKKKKLSDWMEADKGEPSFLVISVWPYGNRRLKFRGNRTHEVEFREGWLQCRAVDISRWPSHSWRHVWRSQHLPELLLKSLTPSLPASVAGSQLSPFRTTLSVNKRSLKTWGRIHLIKRFLCYVVQQVSRTSRTIPCS